MKVTIEREMLTGALRLVGKAVSNKPLIPILGNVLIEAEKDEIRMTANDLGTAIRTSVEAATSKKGRVTIPAKLLKELAGQLPKGPLTLEVKEGQALIKQGTNYYALPITHADEFPAMPGIEEPLFHLEVNVMAEAVYLVGFAASSGSDNALSGINIRTSGPTITFAATDGYRLAVRRFRMVDPLKEVDVTLHAGQFEDLCSVLPRADKAMAAIYTNGDHLVFDTETVRASTRRLAGKFPDYDKIIPAAFDRKIELKASELIASLKRVALFGYGDGRIVKLQMGGDQIVLQGRAADQGEAQEMVPAKLTGGPITISVNAKYLLEALAIVPHQNVEINLNDEQSAIVLRVPGEEHYTSLIMPVRP